MVATLYVIDVVSSLQLMDVFSLGVSPEWNKPLKRIFDLACWQGCRAVVVEEPHKHDEYSVEYDTFYSTLFKTPTKQTQRLHFFASTKKDIDLQNLSKSQKDYLGYCVLRPIKSPRVIEAILNPLGEESGLMETFTICQTKYPVEIRARPAKNNKVKIQHLEVNGFPFIQPDGYINSCAHGAIASIDRFLCRRNEIIQGKKTRDPCLMTQIDRLILPDQVDVRDYPAPGLFPQQIKTVLQKLGYAARVYYLNKKNEFYEPARIIHYYLESGIPIILGVPTESSGHAMTVIGHACDPHSWWSMAQKPYYNTPRHEPDYQQSSDWTETFIVQDSNFGPYLKISKSFICEKAANEDLELIIPLPKNIHARGEDVEPYVYSLLNNDIIQTKLQQATHEASKGTRNSIGIFFRSLNNNSLILRTYLIGFEEFTQLYHGTLELVYTNAIQIPEMIWVVEVSTPELFAKSKSLGEILVDSTAMLRFGEPSYLAIHLPGLVILRNVDTEDVDCHAVPNDVLSEIVRMQTSF